MRTAITTEERRTYSPAYTHLWAGWAVVTRGAHKLVLAQRLDHCGAAEKVVPKGSPYRGEGHASGEATPRGLVIVPAIAAQGPTVQVGGVRAWWSFHTLFVQMEEGGREGVAW